MTATVAAPNLETKILAVRAEQIHDALTILLAPGSVERGPPDSPCRLGSERSRIRAHQPPE
jgi:hypothetical protein